MQTHEQKNFLKSLQNFYQEQLSRNDQRAHKTYIENSEREELEFKQK